MRHSGELLDGSWFTALTGDLVMRWNTSSRFDEKTQAYEQAADIQLLWRLRRTLMPGRA